MSPGDEFIIYLDGGLRFYTGGWESTGSLRRTLQHECGDQWHGTIAGSFTPDAPSYRHTYIDPSRVVAIVDLREETV